MINIDKTDALYKYLSGLGVQEIETEYLELASMGRYTKEDVMQVWSEFFRPSLTNDLDEKELEKIVDYYSDLKLVKKISAKELNSLLKDYKNSPTQDIKSKIINSQLKDVMYLCLNYNSQHQEIDIQDIIQVANIGLLTALEKYDANAKIDFKDYVIYHIRKTIKEEYGEKNNG